MAGGGLECEALLRSCQGRNCFKSHHDSNPNPPRLNFDHLPALCAALSLGVTLSFELLSPRLISPHLLSVAPRLSAFLNQPVKTKVSTQQLLLRAHAEALSQGNCGAALSAPDADGGQGDQGGDEVSPGGAAPASPSLG